MQNLPTDKAVPLTSRDEDIEAPTRTADSENDGCVDSRMVLEHVLSLADTSLTESPKGWMNGSESSAANDDPLDAQQDEFDLPDEDPDGLTSKCPTCGRRAEYPDCEHCGHMFGTEGDETTDQGPNTGSGSPDQAPIVARQADADRLMLIVPDELRSLKSWLIWKRIPVPGKKDRKVPMYVSGPTRHGEQGSAADRSNMVTFDEALRAFRERLDVAGIGLAMLGEGITALDFDRCIDESGHIDPDVLALVAETYAEISPSGRGVRAFLRGSMPDRKHDAGKPSGIEVFSGNGFVTVTGRILAGAAQDLAALTDAHCAAINARLGGSDAPAIVLKQSSVEVDDTAIKNLKSALDTIPADARDVWVYIGQCLRSLGDAGHTLWQDWSKSSAKYDPADATRVWNSLDAVSKHGIAGVFTKAKSLGWTRPRANDAPDWLVNAAKSREYRFVHAAELLHPTRVCWLIEQYIEFNTSALLFGASAAGKSFVAIDWACCIATGTPWHGRPVQQGAVFVIAGEGHAGIGRRLRAWELHRQIGLATAPLFISVKPAALISSVSATEVRKAVEKLIASYGKPALIVVDTLARNLGEGDESSAEDMGKYVSNLDDLRTELACTVLTVHHSGHIEQQRARGSSALKAAVDHEFRLTLTQTEQRILECTKSKDSEPTPPLALKLNVITLVDWALDGDEAPTSCVLVPDAATAGGPRGRKPLTGANRIAMEELRRTIEDDGVPPGEAILKEKGALLAPSKVVHEDVWRERCYLAAIAEGDQGAKQKAFARARNALRDRGYVGVWDGYVWPLLPA
jgi:putative DNA primase/helicase